MQNALHDEHMDQLVAAILKLETPEECYALFGDLFTVAELLAIRQRYWVAQLLKQGYLYADIVEMTGASTATISRVNRCLNYGQGGYQKALERENPEK
jgi:TrpR-related protein YerC/YecD